MHAFCLPCQSRGIRNIVEKKNHKVIIIGLTCNLHSKQLKQQHIYCGKKGIDIKQYQKLQYRGNGWPSSIQIETNNSKKIEIPNNKSIWTEIFHSRLFIRPKCFMCKDTLNKNCDIALADPWLQDCIKN